MIQKNMGSRNNSVAMGQPKVAMASLRALNDPTASVNILMLHQANHKFGAPDLKASKI